MFPSGVDAVPPPKIASYNRPPKASPATPPRIPPRKVPAKGTTLPAAAPINPNNPAAIALNADFPGDSLKTNTFNKKSARAPTIGIFLIRGDTNFLTNFNAVLVPLFPKVPTNAFLAVRTRNPLPALVATSPAPFLAVPSIGSLTIPARPLRDLIVPGIPFTTLTPLKNALLAPLNAAPLTPPFCLNNLNLAAFLLPIIPVANLPRPLRIAPLNPPLFLNRSNCLFFLSKNFFLSLNLFLFSGDSFLYFLR